MSECTAFLQPSTQRLNECVVALLTFHSYSSGHCVGQRRCCSEPVLHEQREGFVADSDVAFQPFVGARQAIKSTCQGRLEPLGAVRRQVALERDLDNDGLADAFPCP